MAIAGDGETVDFSTPKISYKDYLELWEFILEKGKFKVSVSAFDSVLCFLSAMENNYISFPLFGQKSFLSR